MNKNFLFTYEKYQFYWQSWEPATPKAILLVIHGMGEHGGRYAEVAQFFNPFNYVVCALDHFGHGKSQGKRGDLPSMDFMLNSVDQFIKEVYKTYGKLPAVLYGHSMGGNVVANFLLQRHQDFKVAMITSPWLVLPEAPPKWRIALAKLMMKIYPAYQDVTGLDVKAISRDPAVVKAYENDPLVHDKMTPRFYFAMEEGGLFAIDYAERINIPVLLMHGKADRITGITGSVLMYENNPNQIHFKDWEGAYHELHHDIIKGEVMEYMIDFVAGRMR